jgi:peptidoglycan/LPS O-acetylase OafA/YrhL
MRAAGFVIGIVLALIGAVWVLQGLNSQLVPQSFMTGTRTWLVIGGVTCAIGLGIAWRNRPGR